MGRFTDVLKGIGALIMTLLVLRWFYSWRLGFVSEKEALTGMVTSIIPVSVTLIKETQDSPVIGALVIIAVLIFFALDEYS